MNILETQLFSRLLASGPFSQNELALTIFTAPDRYKDHLIKKRNGRGNRLISQPTAEVKHLQRVIIRDEMKGLAIHSAAVGYRNGRSIKDHAAPHASSRYLLKLDFKDFFPSLKVEALFHCLRRDAKYTEPELWILGQILCRKDRESKRLQLSIGAPSSPFISNYLMAEFDSRVHAFCAVMQVNYTRYADDMAFSTSIPRLLNCVQDFVGNLIAELRYLSLELNAQKTVNVSMKHQRSLVGLRLANQGTVSIGREAKRNLRAGMHHFSQGILTPAQISTLRGHLAFVNSFDPEFVRRLCSRYGFERISEIGNIRLVACS